VENFAIEEFGKLLVEKVRDVVIQSCDRELGRNAQSVVAKRWREVMRHATPESFAKEIIPDIVDDTICGLLVAIDQELLHLSFTASTGETVDLVSVGRKYGELCGSYGPGTSSGWVAQHSKERFAHDLYDIDDMFSQ
jgi:hypothetical protein